MKKRILASLMALCLIVGLLPTAALAAEEPSEVSAESTVVEPVELSVEEPTEPEEPAEEPGVPMEELTPAKPVSEDAEADKEAEADMAPLANDGMSGTCGAEGNEDNVKWELTQNNNNPSNPTYTLTISGSGAMKDYTAKPYSEDKEESPETPWYSYYESITKLVIEQGVTSIGNNAFRKLSAITDALVIPDGVTRVGEHAFRLCSGFTGPLTIPNSVVTIGKQAFQNCSGLTGNLVIPDSVQNLGSNVFFGDSGFTGALTLGKGLTSIETGTFRQCQFSTINWDRTSITSIGNYAFYDNDALISLEIPNSVTSIGDFAFAQPATNNSPSKLKSISMSDSVTTIGKQAFAYDAALETVSLSENLTAIAESTFLSCTSLQSIVIPANVKTIGKGAFQLCNQNLGYIIIQSNSINIPEKTNVFQLAKGGIVYYCGSNYDDLDGTGASVAIVDGGYFPKEMTFTTGYLSQPAHKDYNFGGWMYATNTGAQKMTPEADGRYKYKGHCWVIWTSKITFDPHGGTLIDGKTITVEKGKAINSVSDNYTLPTPTRTGYTFTGWYTAAEGGTKVESSTVPTGNTTLYAQWTPNTYTINFNANGGTGTMDNIEATYDRVVELSANGFTMTGKNFAGWAKEANAVKAEYGDQTEVLNLAESDTVTLYAVWTDKNVREPDLSNTVVTYNGQPQKFHVDDNYTVKYYQNCVEVTAPTNAGIYDVEITRAEDEDYAAYHGRIMGGLVINKAPLTIKADDQSIRAGGALPKFTYTVTGLAGEDPLLKTPVLTCDADGKTVGTYTIKASGADAGANYTITYVDGTLTVSKRSSGGGSSGGSSSSGSTTTETEKNPDGSTTTTVTDKKTGIVTETTKYKDGSTLVVETQKDGTVTTTETAKNGVKVKTVDEPGEDVTAKITVPKSVGEVVVTIPADADYGMVAVDAKTGEVVKLSVPTRDGMTVKLDGSAELVLVDRSRGFTDTRGHWAEDAIDFAAAHELFSGTGDAAFTPDSPMTRAMLMTVLARFDGQDITGGAVWYEKAMAWAKENGISDGSDPDGSITREQLATMLWRYAGSPAGDGSLSAFGDSASVSSYAAEALRWAVGEGLISGTDGGLLAPQGSATRAQVATILMRFVESLTK
jgi:uncharacterized repeat protein (TIGR02543 family)